MSVTNHRLAVGAAEEQLAGLLDQIRDTVARFVAEVPNPPKALRVRAGEVSFDVEWLDGQATFPDSPQETVEVTGGEHLTAPAVGTFYRSPEPGAPPFVDTGDTVLAGQQIAIIETMKLMVPVTAERPGLITGVLKEDGEPVEFGERLFAITDGDE